MQFYPREFPLTSNFDTLGSKVLIWLARHNHGAVKRELNSPTKNHNLKISTNMSKDIGCAFTLCPIQALRKFASVISWARSFLSQATLQLDSTRPGFLQQTRAESKRSIFATWKRASQTSLMRRVLGRPCSRGRIS